MLVGTDPSILPLSNPCTLNPFFLPPSLSNPLAPAQTRILEAQLTKSTAKYQELLTSYETLNTRYGEVKRKLQAALANETKFK